jgi:hypothetical protein
MAACISRMPLFNLTVVATVYHYYYYAGRVGYIVETNLEVPRKMEAVCSSEWSASTLETTRHPNPEHHHSHCRQNVESHNFTSVCSTETIDTGKANVNNRRTDNTARPSVCPTPSQLSWEVHCGEKWGFSIEQGITNRCQGTNYIFFYRGISRRTKGVPSKLLMTPLK